MDCPHSGKLFDNGFVLSVAIRIGVTDLVMISYTLELIIRQVRRRQVISMAVHLCRGSAEILL